MYLQKSIQTDLNFGFSVHYNKNQERHLEASEKDRQFYSKLPKSLIKQLYYTIYETDFQMLGYEYPQEYIDIGHDDEVD